LFEFDSIGVFLRGWIASVAIMALIIASARHHSMWSSGPKESIQKLHHGVIPRIG